MSIDLHASSALADLVRLCLAGDETAWHRIVDRYQGLVFGIARHEGLSTEAAADIAQQVFTVLLERLHTVEEVERLPAWIATVARRHAWRARDVHRREPAVDTVALDVTARVGSGDPSDPVEDRVEALWLHEAVRDLGAPCAELLACLYFDPCEPSYAEIAARTGRSIGSIGPSRARCLDKLRQKMQADGLLRTEPPS